MIPVMARCLYQQEFELDLKADYLRSLAKTQKDLKRAILLRVTSMVSLTNIDNHNKITFNNGR
jgi:hypothetical protein